MCSLEKARLFWYELLPYVNVEPCNHEILNRTGVIFEFFQESMIRCCGYTNVTQALVVNEKLSNQQQVFNRVHELPNALGMPISLDAEFPHMPTRFIPVVETDGLFWVKVKEPIQDGEAFHTISTTGLPLLLVVITMTGYAAVILWLLERTSKHQEFHPNFILGVAEAYWCAFISATTIGYGDKVAHTRAGKMFSMLWIMIGTCLMSLFTAIITTIMSSFMAPGASAPKPFYDEFIGVLEGSFDYLVLVKKSANSILYPDTDSLMEALNNGSTFNIVMDKHAYWVYRAKIHQNQSFEFRSGVQNPTSIGYLYNTNNASLLRCLKDFAMLHQSRVSAHIEELVREAIMAQPPDKVVDETTLFFGPHTYTVIFGAIAFLIFVCVLCGIVDFLLRRWFPSEVGRISLVEQEQEQQQQHHQNVHLHSHQHLHQHPHQHNHLHQHPHQHSNPQQHLRQKLNASRQVSGESATTTSVDQLGDLTPLAD